MGMASILLFIIHTKPIADPLAFPFRRGRLFTAGFAQVYGDAYVHERLA